MYKTLKKLILAAEFSVIIAVLSQFTFPLGIIPLTGQTFAISCTATILGKKVGSTAVCMYLLLGVIGMPVFAGMSGGIGVLFGPTGGYLVGFVVQTWLIGSLMKHSGNHYLRVLLANWIGSVGALCCGTLWLMLSANLSFLHAITSGFLPFVFPEMVKSTMAASIGIILKKRLNRFHFTDVH
ncbi:biotin transporter BioY [Enterococcus ratti]|uniref:biotin transporter BioY n=1 Tax=Enterococcus ratti TaxID=150033 RepID=UPI0035192407